MTPARQLLSVIYKKAMREHPDLLEVATQAELKQLIKESVSQITFFEDSSYQPTIPETKKEAEKLAAIWTISSIGLLNEPFKPEDNPIYHQPWAAWMTRRRLLYTEWLLERHTERIAGEQLYKTHYPGKRKMIMQKYSPWMIYNGTKSENADLVHAIARNELELSEAKIFIINAPHIKKTIDQVQTFKLPPRLKLETGQYIGIVAHAPQLKRLLHMMHKKAQFPFNFKVKLFPLPTPAPGKEAYMIQETIGLLVYIYKLKLADRSMYKYVL